MRHATLLMVTLFTISFSLCAQVSITGPRCAIAGTTYQYNITGIDSATNIQVCVFGGMIEGTGSSCTSGSPGQVKVVWDSTVASSNISVTSSSGNSSFTIVMTPPLNGGLIKSGYTTQVVDSGSVPQSISCVDASGGDCHPVYVYQWQQSENTIVWHDIENKTGQNLEFQSPAIVPAFYRRKVTESKSGTIKYSDAAAVFIAFKEDQEYYSN